MAIITITVVAVIIITPTTIAILSITTIGLTRNVALDFLQQLDPQGTRRGTCVAMQLQFALAILDESSLERPPQRCLLAQIFAQGCSIVRDFCKRSAPMRRGALLVPCAHGMFGESGAFVRRGVSSSCVHLTWSGNLVHLWLLSGGNDQIGLGGQIM